MPEEDDPSEEMVPPEEDVLSEEAVVSEETVLPGAEDPPEAAVPSTEGAAWPEEEAELPEEAGETVAGLSEVADPLPVPEVAEEVGRLAAPGSEEASEASAERSGQGSSGSSGMTSVSPLGEVAASSEDADRRCHAMPPSRTTAKTRTMIIQRYLFKVSLLSSFGQNSSWRPRRRGRALS